MDQDDEPSGQEEPGQGAPPEMATAEAVQAEAEADAGAAATPHLATFDEEIPECAVEEVDYDPDTAPSPASPAQSPVEIPVPDSPSDTEWMPERTDPYRHDADLDAREAVRRDNTQATLAAGGSGRIHFPEC